MGRFLRLGLVVAVAFIVLAPDQPDTLTVDDVNAFRDLLETGDMLVVAEYNIAYTALPTDDADTNYIVRLRDGTTTLGTNVPYPYNDGGYGKGIVSVYLTAAEVTAASLGTWPFAGLSLELAGNPTVFTSVPFFTYNLGTSNYSSGSGQTTNQSQLTTEILSAAADLQSAWGTTLLNESGLLDVANGAPYFTLAIPTLRLMATSAFSVVTESPTVPTPVPTIGGAGTLAGTSRDRFDSTPWLTPAFDATGSTLGLPAGAFQGILVMVLLLFVSFLGLRMGGGNGAVMGFGVGLVVVIPVGLVLGFLTWWLGIFIIAILATGGIFKFTRAYL